MDRALEGAPERELGVIVVFDPERGGGDFAYTTAARDDLGFELHLWARPTDGTDPGEDWILSPRDRHSVLVDAVERIATGAVGIGESYTLSFDDGLSSATFTLGIPEPAPAYDTYQLPDGVPVVALRWELQRHPGGDEDAPLSDAALAATEADVAAILAARAARAAYWAYVPEWEDGPGPGPFDDMTEEQRTELRAWGAAVAARRGALSAIVCNEAWELVVLAPASVQRVVVAATAVVTEASRVAGRRGALDVAVTLARQDARVLFPDGEDRLYRDWVAHVLANWYGSGVVVDLLTGTQRAAASGWLDACCDPLGATDHFVAQAGDERISVAAARITGVTHLGDSGDPESGLDDVKDSNQVTGSNQQGDEGSDEEASDDDWIVESVRAAHSGLGAPLSARWAGRDADGAAVPLEVVAELIRAVLSHCRAQPTSQD